MNHQTGLASVSNPATINHKDASFRYRLMASEVPLTELIDLIDNEADMEILRQGETRQRETWEDKEPDYLPILINESVIDRKGLPSYDMREQFLDAEEMLYEQLWSALGAIRAKSDAIPSVRINFGVGFLASIFGLTQQIFPDKMPWLKEHLRKQEISTIARESLDPIIEKGLLPRFRQYLETYREHLARKPVKVYLPDTQGPFDIAHLAMGDSIFSEFHRRPELVLHLLSLTGYIYRETTSWLKSLIGEPLDGGYHSCNLVMSNCGARCCEDSTTLLSPELAGLAVPYLKEAVKPFSCWIHFCGNGLHIMKIYLELEEVKAVNLGNPEMYHWPAIMKGILDAQKIYYGQVSRDDGETLSAYFRRVLSPLERKGNLIFQPILREGEGAGEAIAIWHQLQDELFR